MFDAAGNHLHDIRGNWVVVHSIVLFEDQVSYFVSNINDNVNEKVSYFLSLEIFLYFINRTLSALLTEKERQLSVWAQVFNLRRVLGKPPTLSLT